MAEWAMPPGVPSQWADADRAAHIRHLAEQGDIEWPPHADAQLRHRRITRAQVLKVLMYGQITKTVAATPPYTGVKCTMAYNLPDGYTTVIVALSDANHAPAPYLTIVTEF